LSKAWNREETRFRHDYNDKLLNGLVFAMLAAILLFRFVIRVSLLETGAWVGFIFLQVRNGRLSSRLRTFAVCTRLGAQPGRSWNVGCAIYEAYLGFSPTFEVIRSASPSHVLMANAGVPKDVHQRRQHVR
jgi:hypothetical protein